MRVEQTYFSTLTAHRSGSKSRNTKMHQSIQSSRQILSFSKISLLQSSISYPYSMLDTTHEWKTMAITIQGKVISSIFKDFLAWHVMLIQINNRPHDFNKGNTMLGVIEHNVCSDFEKHE